MKEKSANPKYLLYLDTSESEANLAVYMNNEKIADVRWEAGRELSKTLSKKYTEILKKSKISQNEIAGICVFSGPGSFTGLRIGISFANALAYGLSIPIYETKKRGELITKKAKKIIVPFYGSPPRITKPKGK